MGQDRGNSTCNCLLRVRCLLCIALSVALLYPLRQLSEPSFARSVLLPEAGQRSKLSEPSIPISQLLPAFPSKQSSAPLQSKSAPAVAGPMVEPRPAVEPALAAAVVPAAEPAVVPGPAEGRAGPQRDTAGDVVIALAAYNKPVSSFNLALVNTLRGVGFRGAIFLGMWEGTPDPDGYMARAGVTPKYLRRVPCQLRYELAAGATNYEIRNVCTEDFPHLKLEWARFLYARRWLEQCPTCTGWALHADFGDVNFQLNPFAVLPDNGQVPPDTVFLTEEMPPRVDAQGRQRGASTSHWFVRNAVRRCYGQEASEKVANHTMLNVGTTLGPRAGMLRWLKLMEEEFEKLSTRSECDPNVIADQAVFNYLFYAEGAMIWATPKKYGTWIVNSMGLPCSNQAGLKPDHSLDDIVIIDGAGRVWNEDGTLPAVVHQGKVCWLNYQTRVVNKFSGPGALGTRDAELRGLAGGRFPGAGPNR